MLGLKAKFGEPLEQYYFGKLNLLNRCQITGRNAVDCLLAGIEDRAIRLGAQAATYDRPEQVLKYLKTVKVGQVRENTGAGFRLRNDRRPQTLPSNSSNKFSGPTNKTPIKCFNCGAEGHPSFKCPKPIEKCNNCYRIGHRTASCPAMSKSKTTETEKENPVEKQVLKIDFDKQKGCNDKYIMNVAVNDTPLTECFVDMGSECTLIRQAEAKTLGLKLSTDNLPLLRGLGGNLVKPIGKTDVTIEVQDVEETVEVLVVDDDVLKRPLLLGHTFTEKPSVLISKTPTRLIFEKISDDTKLFLTVQSDTQVSGNDMISVPIICDREYTGKIYIDGMTNVPESIMNDVLDDTLTVASPENLRVTRQKTGENIRKQQEKERDRFNKKRKTPHVYKEGDLVCLEREIGSNDGKSRKLVAKYQGPYRIAKILSRDRFVIEDTPITRKRNHQPYKAIVAVDKLRPWLNLTTDLNSSSEEEDELLDKSDAEGVD
ncbi:aspartyl protease domain-containing protein [Phthorimaea operculella]|nr:aspartyl protease domain-containing protein [Phthorimaea operculella]